ncbi:hypothetical protein ASF71_17310 [Deinococcus sp. Leaf326]|nr:hypothetical protein ASF71_17310 [Deinococcus sp. Leaf326]
MTLPVLFSLCERASPLFCEAVFPPDSTPEIPLLTSHQSFSFQAVQHGVKRAFVSGQQVFATGLDGLSDSVTVLRLSLQHGQDQHL